jgi:hypothetical protein
MDKSGLPKSGLTRFQRRKRELAQAADSDPVRDRSKLRQDAGSSSMVVDTMDDNTHFEPAADLSLLRHEDSRQEDIQQEEDHDISQAEDARQEEEFQDAQEEDWQFREQQAAAEDEGVEESDDSEDTCHERQVVAEYPQGEDDDPVLAALLLLSLADPSAAVQELSSRFQVVRQRHETTHAGARATWDAMWRFCKVMSQIKEQLPIVVCYKTSRTLAHKALPPFHISTVHLNILTGEYVADNDMARFPVKQYRDTTTWALCYDITEVRLLDVMDHFEKDHPDLPRPLSLILSLDGVPEAKSGNSIDVVSLKVEGCLRVYPIKIIRPKRLWVKSVPHEHRLDIYKKMGNVLEDVRLLSEQGRANLRLVVADAPMRAALRMQKQHGAYYSCDYCVQRATLCGSVRVFPFKHGAKPPARTRALMMSKADLFDTMTLKEREERADELFGLVGRSPLLQVPGFDPVTGVVADAMHLIYLGVAKRLLHLTFNIGTARDRGLAERRLDINPLSFMLIQQKVPSDFPRRTREYDPHWKASEYRNLVLALFPLVVCNIPEGRKERELWLLLAFLTRACILPDAEYNEIHPSHLLRIQDRFYKEYTRLFGVAQCTYNLHVYSHLQEIRQQGKLQDTSAFAFEASYAIIKNSFWPGTVSHGKQAMYRVMSKYCGSDHKCKRALLFEAHVTSKKDNSIAYCRDKNFYRLTFAGDKEHPDTFVGKRIPTGVYTPGQTRLPFDQVGVFRVVGEPVGLSIHIERRDVIGKGIIVECGIYDIILNLPTDLLLECT